MISEPGRASAMRAVTSPGPHPTSTMRRGASPRRRPAISPTISSYRGDELPNGQGIVPSQALVISYREAAVQALSPRPTGDGVPYHVEKELRDYLKCGSRPTASLLLRARTVATTSC
jgi:hypothetical protein